MNYLEYLAASKDEMIKSLADVVKIKSVLAPAVKTADGTIYPFGQGVENAYENIINLAESMGFKTANFDNYGGHIDFYDDGIKRKNFAIVAHLDVVPEGDDWQYPPYAAEIHDNWMYGRGTTDDKGPVIENLYAMKAIKDAGIKPDMNIRLILGLDEETEKEGMVYYLEKAGAPDLGYTPDGDFPLVNGEMGIVNFDIAMKMPENISKNGLLLKSMKSGEMPNIVPGSARAVVNSADKKDYGTVKETVSEFCKKTGYDIKTKGVGSSLEILVTGRSAHGARPQNGLNSISIMMELFSKLNFASEDLKDYVDYYNKYVGFNLHGEKIGCPFEDEPSGKLIFNVGMADFNEEAAAVTVNLRYPVTNTDAEVYEGIEATLKGTKIGIVKKALEEPVYMKAEDPFVVELMNAYREETGDTVNQSKVLGGGTYAKLMKNVLAYGACFPEDEDRMHMSNERLDLDQFMKAARIYANAICKITCEK